MNDTFRIGMRVLAGDDDVGVVDDILVTREGVLRFIVVMHNGVFGSDVVLPVNEATVAGNRIRLSLTKAQVEAGERYDRTRHGESAGLFSVSAGRYDRQDD